METYIIDKIKYTVPVQDDINMVNVYTECDFDNPEALMDIWLKYALWFGPQLVYVMIEHFRTLSDPDMPSNYIEDFIEEFWERLGNKLFVMQNRRFKLIKTTDKLSNAFSTEVEQRSGLTIDHIDEMTGIEFEHFLCRLFNESGYNATLTKASNDQGADLILEKLGERTVVQAKRYFGAVSNTAVQEVVAAKAYYRCENGMVVTNSYFTKSAITLAMSNKVTLYDREKLKEKLETYNLNLSNDIEEE